MALLHYENLGVRHPDILLRRTFGGLRDFYEYLKRTIEHLESESSVLRLAWSPARAPDGFGDAPDGIWVELSEPRDRPNEPDRTFDAFLDEEVREVFELDPAQSKRVSLNRDHRLGVLDRDPDTCRLLLDREPELSELCLRPNTTTLRRQRDAVKQLQDAPSPWHVPLLRLFEPTRHVIWPRVPQLAAEPSWQVLTDEQRPGTTAQRNLVRLALCTPDFAFLEGPPGSGKTTAICELALQLVGEGKRVLLCASTHVAVDNVLERLGPLSEGDASELVPVRVGERRKVSEKARPYQLEELARTERQRILAFLRTKRPPSDAQRDLMRALSRDASPSEPMAIERMILDAANLVCGTTTGILRHPDIRAADAARRAGMFDVLILDEASKTTFQEFLVPALLAKRWIIVGDAHQLSPYVEEEAVAANLLAALPDPVTRNACVDVFLASRERPRAAVIVDDRVDVAERYRSQAAARGVEVRAPGDPDVGLAHIVVGAPSPADRDRLPLDVGTLRGDADDVTRRRAAAHLRAIDTRQDDPPRWEEEIGWRLCRRYELRCGGDSQTTVRLDDEIGVLLPAASDHAVEDIDRVRRVAFPSVLESLQDGFERRAGQRDGTALTDGLPDAVFSERHVLLEYQHRMHPEISALPRTHVYAGAALKDPPNMAALRAWSYPRYQRRAVFVHVAGRFEKNRKRNLDEVEQVIRELDHFRRWAERAPKPAPAEGPWEVAVLTFYRGQERALRERLRRYARAPNAFRHFALGADVREDVHVELCTVDRFQGHEADVVFLSIASTHPTNFLESVNRINVAVTRARYQRVVIGNRHRLGRREGTLLQQLTNEAWELDLEGAR